MGMFYSNPSLQLSILSESIDNEINNFNKLLESINILNENNILLEKVDMKELWNKFKEKIKEIWQKFKDWIKKVIKNINEAIQKIKAKFNRKKIEDDAKAIENAIAQTPEEEKEAKFNKVAEGLKDWAKSDLIYYYCLESSKIKQDYNIFKNKDIIRYNINVEFNDNIDSASISTNTNRTTIDEIQTQNNAIFKKFKFKELNDLINSDEDDGIKDNYFLKFSFVRINNKYDFANPHAIFKKILDETPDKYYFDSRLPFNDLLDNYQKALEQLISDKIRLDNPNDYTYYMSGFQSDIQNLKYICNTFYKLYSYTFDKIQYNYHVLAKIASEYNLIFNIHGEVSKKLNNMKLTL